MSGLAAAAAAAFCCDFRAKFTHCFKTRVVVVVGLCTKLNPMVSSGTSAADWQAGRWRDSLCCLAELHSSLMKCTTLSKNYRTAFYLKRDKNPAFSI